MGKHFHCTDEIVVVSKGKEDIGKVPALGNDGKLDPSVIPDMERNASTNPACMVCFAGEPISIPSGVGTVINMNEVMYDTGNFYTGDSGKLQITEAGIYLIVYQVCLSAYGNRTNVFLERNGKEFIACSDPVVDANVSALMRLEKGDYIQPFVRQASGSAISLITQDPEKTENYLSYVSIMKMSN